MRDDERVVLVVYLDNDATMRTDPSIAEAMLPLFTEQLKFLLGREFGSDPVRPVKRARCGMPGL
ncbi:hypothetical protein [Bradyrhizobium genosp. P]|uniref:hypothetical protein n=1 Tax=Bradyrhizobium genosp. P TaxID=83641 RepID=UPI003CFB2378